MQFTECASKCPFTCATQRHICDYGCDPNANCACPDGMVLISKRNGTCIKKEDCPSELEIINVIKYVIFQFKMYCKLIPCNSEYEPEAIYHF